MSIQRFNLRKKRFTKLLSGGYPVSEVATGFGVSAPVCTNGLRLSRPISRNSYRNSSFLADADGCKNRIMQIGADCEKNIYPLIAVLFFMMLILSYRSLTKMTRTEYRISISNLKNAAMITYVHWSRMFQHMTGMAVVRISGRGRNRPSSPVEHRRSMERLGR